MLFKQKGYKLRRQIAQALQHRSTTLTRALAKYNQLAAIREPPAKKLDLAEVLNLAFLSDFELLKSSHGRQDILKRPWSRPLVREAMLLWLRLLRAQEEIAQLNVEVRRVDAYLISMQAHIQQTAANTTATEPLLAKEVIESQMERLQIGIQLQAQLVNLVKRRLYQDATPLGCINHAVTELAQEVEPNSEDNDATSDHEEGTDAQGSRTEAVESVLTVLDGGD